MKILGIGIITLLLYVLQTKIYEKFWDKHLKATIYFAEKELTEGETGGIIEIVENRKRLPLTMLKVKFQTSKHLEFEDNPGSNTTDRYYRNDIFQLGGGEKVTRRLSFQARKRGYYNIQNIDLVSTDLFMQSTLVKSTTTACYLYVYPRVYHSGEFTLSLQKLNGEILIKRHLLEDPFEYRGIREYQPFDDIRSVNWKATARTGKVMVNQKNYTALQTIRIFLNIEDNGIYKKHTEVETSLQIVMGLSLFFLSQGIKVACYTNAKDIVTGEMVCIEGSAGSGQQDVIGKAMARINTEANPYGFCELFEDKILEDAGNTITLFVSPNGYDDFLALLERCHAERIAYTWFYPHDTNKAPEVPKQFMENVRFLRCRRYE